MAFTAKYMEASLYYLPWKTKFIEVFCILYARLQRKICQHQDIESIVKLYFETYKTMLNVLQKKLKSDNGINVKFYSDIIESAFNVGYISEKEVFFEALNFLNFYNYDKTNTKLFKSSYIKILDEFSRKFKEYVRLEGMRDKNYVIYDNSYCLWGIDENYYYKLIKLFSKYEKLKLVRIFGSRVTQEYKTYSDIDLIFEGTYAPEEFQKIREAIQNAEFPYILDIYDICMGNKPFIYRNVVRSNLFYKREDYISII